MPTTKKMRFLMNEVILVINAGSSSLKCALFSWHDLKVLYKVKIKGLFETPCFLVYNEAQQLIYEKKNISPGYTHAFHLFFQWMETLSKKIRLKIAVHRVVHGGLHFHHPQKISPQLLDALKTLIPLAPLHQPHNLEAIQIVTQYYPHLTQIACFDTAFHKNQLYLHQLYALPTALSQAGLIRYGFHGLSYEYIASTLEQHLGERATGKILIAHLGNGASVCALHHLKSVATSMGFSTLEGPMMGTRCGTLDPGILLYLLQEKEYTPDQIENLLYHESGWFGVSGVSKDMCTLLAHSSPQAQLAVDLFCYKAAQACSALLPALNGCEALVFTAGIGENAPLVRQKICNWLAWLGIQLNMAANQSNSTVLNTQESKIKVLVIPTNEEYVLALHAKNYPS